jgi:hypothetical protein
VRGAVLGAGDEVALDPEPEPVPRDELAVGVEVVERLFLPEGVAPEVERLAKAVDVLGDPQLLDPGRGGGVPVALDVRGGEVPLRRRVLLVGPQVQVIVGQHAPTLRPARTCRDLGVHMGA